MLAAPTFETSQKQVNYQQDELWSDEGDASVVFGEEANKQVIIVISCKQQCRL